MATARAPEHKPEETESSQIVVMGRLEVMRKRRGENISLAMNGLDREPLLLLFDEEGNASLMSANKLINTRSLLQREKSVLNIEEAKTWLITSTIDFEPDLLDGDDTYRERYTAKLVETINPDQVITLETAAVMVSFDNDTNNPEIIGLSATNLLEMGAIFPQEQHPIAWTKLRWAIRTLNHAFGVHKDEDISTCYPTILYKSEQSPKCIFDHGDWTSDVKVCLNPNVIASVMNNLRKLIRWRVLDTDVDHPAEIQVDDLFEMEDNHQAVYEFFPQVFAAIRYIHDFQQKHFTDLGKDYAEASSIMLKFYLLSIFFRCRFPDEAAFQACSNYNELSQSIVNTFANFLFYLRITKEFSPEDMTLSNEEFIEPIFEHDLPENLGLADMLGESIFSRYDDDDKQDTKREAVAVRKI